MLKLMLLSYAIASPVQVGDGKLIMETPRPPVTSELLLIRNNKKEVAKDQTTKCREQVGKEPSEGEGRANMGRLHVQQFDDCMRKH